MVLLHDSAVSCSPGNLLASLIRKVVWSPYVRLQFLSLSSAVYVMSVMCSIKIEKWYWVPKLMIRFFAIFTKIDLMWFFIQVSFVLYNEPFCMDQLDKYLHLLTQLKPYCSCYCWVVFVASNECTDHCYVQHSGLVVDWCSLCCCTYCLLLRGHQHFLCIAYNWGATVALDKKNDSRYFMENTVLVPLRICICNVCSCYDQSDHPHC